MKSSATLWWSALAAFSLPHHVSGATNAQPAGPSFVAGNLSAAAPYGIPPAEFQKVTERLAASATFNITGYDVSSSPPADSSSTNVPGWTLTVGVTTDVSLLNAANSSNLDIEATTLFLAPPGGNVTLDPSWTICAVVFPGLEAEAAAAAANVSTKVDGSCEGLLSSECIEAIQSGSSGVSTNGTCGSYVLPSACSSQFPEEFANNTAIGRLPGPPYSLTSVLLLPILLSHLPKHKKTHTMLSSILTFYHSKLSTNPSSMQDASTHMAAPRPRRPTRPHTRSRSPTSGRSSRSSKMAWALDRRHPFTPQPNACGQWMGRPQPRVTLTRHPEQDGMRWLLFQKDIGFCSRWPLLAATFDSLS